MIPRIDAEELTLRYGSTTALDHLTFSLAAGKIYGLLGRNGAGKTSLVSVLAAFRQASGGSVLIDGQPVFENRRVVCEVCLVGQGSHAISGGDSAKNVFDLAAHLRPNWDAKYAGRLAERFEIPPGKRYDALSRGQRAALRIVLGLASRAPVTMFDEAYLGMDAPSRYAFYDELLADFMEHPRTVIVSTHHIEELDRLFEEILIIDRGRLLLHEETDVLRSRGVSVTGRAGDVDAFAEGRTLLGEKRLGPTKAATIYGELDDHARARAEAAGLELGPIGLQDLFVHLTSGESR